jgi:UDPglucose 6-dehydrogenase
MNPEFYREGVAVDDFQNPDRIIIGFEDKESKARLDELYLHFNCNKLFTDCTSAEMIKFVSNAFLATKISFANEIGNICKQIGIDTEKVFEGVGMDSRINPAFFASGIGFGGSCFPKDVNALQNFANSKGLSTKMLSAVLDVNDDQPLQMIHLLKKYIPEISGSQIGILGLSFKPGTDDIRESRTIPIIREILFLGAKVIAYDPLAQEKMKNLFPEITYADTSAEVLASDAVLITTAHQEFEELIIRV